MRIDIISLFPETVMAPLDESIVARARKKGLVQICCHDLRSYSCLPHSRVDDCVFGGGKGMLLMAEPVAAAVEAIESHNGMRSRRVYMSPRGEVLTQKKAKELSQESGLVILCGHYEGVDERVLEEYSFEEISIGDFVLTGGELPAVILSDAVCRMIDGVLSAEECFSEESHFGGLLEYPQYTRPETWRGRAVPEVLLSGHHENIRKWRRKSSLELTRRRRPDIFRDFQLSAEDEKLLL